MIRKFFILWGLCLGLLPLLAQPKVLDARLLSANEKLVAGAENKIAVEIVVHTPWHINGNQPLSEFLIPTEVFMDSLPDITFGAFDYPEADEKMFDFSDEPMRVYEETVVVYGSVIVSETFSETETVIKGAVYYQACNDQFCLPPKSQSFELTLSIAKEGEENPRINTAIFGKE